jgi:hypothetical protein
VGQCVQENPWGFGQGQQVFDERPQTRGARDKGLAGGEGQQPLGNTPLGEARLAKQTARQEKERLWQDLGSRRWGTNSSAALLGWPAPTGSTRAREATQDNDPESQRGDARADARARALVGEQHDAGLRTLGARRRWLADRPGGGGARNGAKNGGKPACPTAGWYQASMATRKGSTFGTHVKRVRRNGPAVPVRRCAGVRGGGTVARHSMGNGETERKKIEQGCARGTTAAATARKRPRLARRPASHRASAAARRRSR